MLALQTGGAGLTPPTHVKVPEEGKYNSAVALPPMEPPASRTLPASGPEGRSTAVWSARGSVIVPMVEKAPVYSPGTEGVGS